MGAKMYPLPQTPTVADIIERSATCHPSLFADALRDLAKVHADFMHSTADRKAAVAAGNAKKHAVQALQMIQKVEACESARFICHEFSSIGPMLQALTVAAKLQCLPRHLVQDALARHELSKVQS
jgi:ABC-type dipeptide/oligopeptide/nickel transport system ATPase component